MRLKTFVANSMKEALADVRAEMGPDAIIISSQRAKHGGLLVRAALDEPEQDAALEETAQTLQQEQRQSETGDQSVPPVVLPDLEDSVRESMIRRIRGEGGNPRPAPRNFDRAELLSILHHHRAPEALAHAIAEAAEKSGLPDMTLALAAALDMRMPSAPFYPGRMKAILLCGPHGAGKSAVAAKIAAHARLAGRDVTLVAADADGAGAVARLETFAKHLDANFVVASAAETLPQIIAEGARADTVTIIDTAGFDVRDDKARTAFAALAGLDGLEVAGVVSATMDAEEAAETVNALKNAGAGRVIVTGVDLARRLGALLAAATRGIPLAHITRSAFVAGGLETLTPLSLARTLLQAHSLNPDRGSTQ
jgi:flagellar biosynthesis protein FlhF